MSRHPIPYRIYATLPRALHRDPVLLFTCLDFDVSMRLLFTLRMEPDRAWLVERCRVWPVEHSIGCWAIQSQKYAWSAHLRVSSRMDVGAGYVMRTLCKKVTGTSVPRISASAIKRHPGHGIDSLERKLI